MSDSILHVAKDSINEVNIYKNMEYGGCYCSGSVWIVSDRQLKCHKELARTSFVFFLDQWCLHLGVMPSLSNFDVLLPYSSASIRLPLSVVIEVSREIVMLPNSGIYSRSGFSSFQHTQKGPHEQNAALVGGFEVMIHIEWVTARYCMYSSPSLLHLSPPLHSYSEPLTVSDTWHLRSDKHQRSQTLRLASPDNYNTAVKCLLPPSPPRPP